MPSPRFVANGMPFILLDVSFYGPELNISRVKSLASGMAADVMSESKTSVRGAIDTSRTCVR